MGIRPKLILMNRSLITFLNNRERNECHVCQQQFKEFDRVIPAGRSTTTKYYHEDCYGRLLH